MSSNCYNSTDESNKGWFASLCLVGLLYADCAWAQSGAFFRISGPAQTQISSLRPDGTAIWTNGQSASVYTFQVSTSSTEATNWADYVNVIGALGANTNRLFDLHPPTDMAFIPAGSFSMGDSLDGDTTALPLHTVHASAIYVDQFDVTKALWDRVYLWAVTNGYSFVNGGLANGPDHPVQMVDWYDCVKWCNARSEMAGKAVAYYVDAGLHTPYRNGEVEPYVNWTSGYRLPTEAEWERAARGGLNGQRYPWGNTINESLANYNNPDETTTPVTQYPPNGYGLYDMSGNMWQWCWDWYGSYDSGTQTDPHGPSTGTRRVNRGGGMVSTEYQLRAAARTSDLPTFRDNYVGFRCVLPAEP